MDLEPEINLDIEESNATRWPDCAIDLSGYLEYGEAGISIQAESDAFGVFEYVNENNVTLEENINSSGKFHFHCNIDLTPKTQSEFENSIEFLITKYIKLLKEDNTISDASVTTINHIDYLIEQLQAARNEVKTVVFPTEEINL